ncbi:MAG TPA: GNAT family N-acetyltransferase [Nannocystaceae bacterium]|nr:GNAT family N-acetyltransferase [Nannocystaceae bacterium]
MAEIRRATTSDAESLLPMIRELFRDESIAWDLARTRAGLVKLLDDAELGRVLVATHEGHACGYAIVTWGYDLEFAGRDCFLTEIYVAPEQRGRGVGRDLLAAIEHNAREAGAGAVHLQVRPDNPTARELYHRAGFQPSPRIFLSKTL